MPVSGPTDPDEIIDLVKQRTTRFENNHLVLGTSDAWLAIDEQHHAWTTASAAGHQLSINTYNLLRAAEPVRGSNTFKVSAGGVDVFYELRPELRDGAPWAVAETI